jgi:hypothetical protein
MNALPGALVRAVTCGALVVAAACAAESVPDASSPDSSAPLESTQVATPVSGYLGVVDDDPYDGVIGVVEFTPDQRRYQEHLGITDAEAHEAFRYSCGIANTGKPRRFANQGEVSTPDASAPAP